jgi:hypothetical protein
MKECGLGPYGGMLTSLKGEDFFIEIKTVLLHHVLIPHRLADINVDPEWQVIIARSRLTTNTYSEIRYFFSR